MDRRFRGAYCLYAITALMMKAVVVVIVIVIVIVAAVRT
jgi:hypothetical protein